MSEEQKAINPKIETFLKNPGFLILIGEKIQDPDIRAICNFLKKDCHKDITIILSHCELKPKHANWLAYSVAKFNSDNTLRLDLSDNPIGNRGFMCFINKIQTGFFPKNITLDFSNCNIDTTGFKAFGNSNISAYKANLSINLSGNKPGPEGIQSIYEGLSKKVPEGFILDISACELELSGFELISKLLLLNGLTLHYSGNKPGPAGLNHLWEAFNSASFPENSILDLKKSGIVDRNINRLLTALENQQYPKKVTFDLSGNALTRKGISELIKGCSKLGDKFDQLEIKLNDNLNNRNAENWDESIPSKLHNLPNSIRILAKDLMHANMHPLWQELQSGAIATEQFTVDAQFHAGDVQFLAYILKSGYVPKNFALDYSLSTGLNYIFSALESDGYPEDSKLSLKNFSNKDTDGLITSLEKAKPRKLHIELKGEQLTAVNISNVMIACFNVRKNFDTLNLKFSKSQSESKNIIEGLSPEAIKCYRELPHHIQISGFEILEPTFAGWSLGKWKHFGENQTSDENISHILATTLPGTKWKSQLEEKEIQETFFMNAVKAYATGGKLSKNNPDKGFIAAAVRLMNKESYAKNPLQCYLLSQRE